MSAGLSFWIFLVLVCGSSVVCGSSEGLKNIIVEPGENVILTCKDENKHRLGFLEWIREGHDEKKVFVITNGQPFLLYQHESYKNRVFLVDSQMKDGDLSVVLKNVTISDSGTYECKVRHENNPQGELKLLSIIHLFVVPPGVPSPGLKNIIVEPGENVILPCEDENDDGLIVLEWNTESLGEKEAVFVYRDGRPFPSAQHESFKNRVFLKDSESVKDGDLSVVLKDVTISDSGTYECRVIRKRTKRSILDTPPISTIHLFVVPPGDREQLEGDQDRGTKEDGRSRGVPIGIGVLSVLVPAVGLWIYSKKKGSNQSSSGSNEKEFERDPHNLQRKTQQTQRKKK